MKLTKEEIQYIDHYLIKNEVKYWDVRLELLDHIVSAVEDKINNDGISFNEALLEVHKGFGNRTKMGYTKDINLSKSLFIDNKGFKKFTLKKQREIGRKQRRFYRKTLTASLFSKRFLVEYLAIILVTLTIHQFYSEKAAFVTAMIIFLAPELIKLFYGGFDKSNRKSLNMQMAISMGSLIMSLNYFFIAGFNSYFDEAPTKPFIIATLFYLALYPFIRHSFNCYKENLETNKSLYKLMTE